MAESVKVQAERRSTTGKGAARQLRKAGKIPAVLYGHGRETEPLAVPALALEKVLHGISPGSTVIDLKVNGDTSKVLIREIQRHPTKKTITHLDFLEIHAGEVLRLDIPLRLVGSPAGVRNGGGVLEQFMRDIYIEVLPKNIPERVELDVTDLEIGHSLHVKDVEVPDAKVLSEPEATICTVVPPRVEEERPVVEAEEEEVEEPELIRRPKAEEAEAEEGAEEASSEE
ncbi:MAG: 50S ribosomal protein L25 [Gemmatimonadales bacterium]